MPATLTANEASQLNQTIEMFEVITQSQPQDYQSLEILKEAYSKLDRHDAVVQTSKRIAEAYVHLGQLSSAILEYESILQHLPDDADSLKALAAIESKANSFAVPPALEPEPVAPKALPTSRKPADGKPAPAQAAAPIADGVTVDDGRQAMQKLFLDAKLISISDFDIFWPAPNLKESPRGPTDPFIHILSEKQVLPLDKSMKLLSEKSRLAYLPLDKYDVDVDLARTFPRDTCLRWSVLPFDRMSKSVMVATANPFNKQALRELEMSTKARIIYYLVSPVELVKILKKIYR
jgi:tetratricopeptide (TPR) repeat protein